MNRLFITAALLLAAVAAGAQKAGSIVSKPKFSGYFLGQYQASLKDGDNSNSFNLRMARVSVGGRIMDDFEYKIQGQINGNTSTLGSSPRLVDLFVEWQKYSFLKIKAGQFKRPFTFENPMNPIDQGFMGYAQVVNSLSGFSDRTGEHSSNGRDIGIQIQGDFINDASGRPLVHYQAGVFNGQGINVKDVDNRKDIIGGLWVMPVRGLRVGAFGWVGSHARNGSWTDADGRTVSSVRSLSQYRYALSAEYKDADWQIRSEYIHSTGYGFKTTYQQSANLKDAEVNTAAGNKADGLYALCIAPIIRGKLRAKARYDLYRRTAEWSGARAQYEAGLNYLIHKNLEIQAEYAFINDRALDKHNYSMVDVEFCVRF
ncbi:MAG: porin [Prevotella sp.]|nr:porin [Prevotella sp.]